MRVWWFCYDVIFYRHRVLVANNVCCLIFIIVLSYYQQRSLGLLGWHYCFPLVVYGTICMYSKIFYLFIIWQPIKSGMWMSGVRTLCTYTHYRASLLLYRLILKWFLIFLVISDRQNLACLAMLGQIWICYVWILYSRSLFNILAKL